MDLPFVRFGMNRIVGSLRDSAVTARVQRRHLDRPVKALSYQSHGTVTKRL
jgi:hypothetical protein